MACGWSPSLARMLEQMVQEKQQKAHEADVALQHTEEHVARAKQRSDAAEADARSADWTQAYARWDAWEDPEELARREQEARERQECAARSARAAGCDHDHSAEQKLMDMSTTAKLDACDGFRRLGNRFFQHGQYQRAAYHYHKALVYFEYVFPDSDDENARHDALKLKVLLNFAACRLKTHQLDDVVHHASQALAIDPRSVKALYRRAQAHRLRDDFELAQQDLARAAELEGEAGDPLLAQERHLLHAKVLAYKLRSRQVSSAMFRGTGPGDRSLPADARARTRADLPDASVLRLRLTKPAGAGERGASAPLASWQPCTLGLPQLEAVLAQLT
ncbi:hypothetical protein PybrP1_013012 [[Pythium] brassicae (nom. inval.)]|nr:hypothetical protein PybrP1_013012 [[Pythium] brassicae (nom. inval.)]